MTRRKQDSAPQPKYPGIPAADDGSAAIVRMETAASEAAGAYPITPSTQMGEGWAAAVAAGTLNVNGRKLIFFEPEGEHAAAGVTAGMSMMGLRSTNFSSGQGIAYMHESLYAATGKRLTYVLNMACRAMTKHALNVHAGHDDYHAVDDTGFFQLFGKNVQEAADLNLICHRIAELSLNPGICAQDGFLTSHVIETYDEPEPELVREYLGDPADTIDSPTPAQKMVFGERRRRIPLMFDYDYPAMIGVVQNQDAYAQGVAAQRPFYFDHLDELTEQAFEEYAALTGRRYARASGYRLEDAEYVIAGQGSLVWNAEAVADHLRETRGLKVGVLNLTMFRPFPADLVSQLLRGKKAVTVLERLDQPLAVDAPVLREIRAAMGQAMENGRATGEVPHPGVAALRQEEVPEFYSGCFGLGSRDLQPGDLVVAVENMFDGSKQRRQFYLGIDFIRTGTDLPKLQIWQQQLLASYPNLEDLALRPKEDLNLMPPGSTAIRVHSIGGWGAITMGKNVALTAAELLDLKVKANPKYGSEKKGQPTTFYATVAKEPIRLNCELTHVDVVLSPDPNVFRHSNALAGLAEEGVFVIQSDLPPEELWQSLPQNVQIDIRTKRLRVYGLDGFKIAMEEARDAELRYRMQGTAFLGAFFRVARLGGGEELDEARLFQGIEKQMQKKFGGLGAAVVQDNLRVIRRGFDEVREIDFSGLSNDGLAAAEPPRIPEVLAQSGAQPGIADGGRFWEQVCHLYKTGGDGIADPFAAISAIPAVTSAIRNMTDVRFEVPEFIPQNCTGCSQCWTECPDTAIPGLVSGLDEVILAAIDSVEDDISRDRLRQAVPHLAKQARRLLKEDGFSTFADTLSSAYEKLAPKLAPDAERRLALDAEFQPVHAALADFPLAKTTPFFDLRERREPGTGGLLSITVNPQACKGCMLCVEVCPDEALVTVKQDDAAVAKLERNWALWNRLPDTPDRYINISDIEEGIGVLPSLLLKRENYDAMVGGDGSCMGCGEKTAVHLIISAVSALMSPRVEAYVRKLDELIERLDAQARQIISSDTDLESVGSAAGGQVAIALSDEKQALVDRISHMIRDLKDLRWRYVEGPSGQGRALCGFSNATGCSSVWGSTYPFNPFPFPWVNHLFQDAPSVAIGLFEGHMRRMSDGFIAVRRAEAQLADEYEAERDEDFFARFDWLQFSDEEFDMCPPVFAVGGDGAMFDIGFQNLSRMLASGKPIRTIVLDTQVYSNTGGQACTSGFTGQVSDMANFGKAQHGKEEVRKELALIAMAHRGVFVLQTSQASPSHLLSGVLKGLQSKHPSLFLINTPCPPEHGIGDDAAVAAAKLALESRAFPLLEYDPAAGNGWADCLSLEGNPSLDEVWPSRELVYTDESGEEKRLSVPCTVADWAASEGRFKKHFRQAPTDDLEDELIPFHEYLLLSPDAREAGVPFIYVYAEGKRLRHLLVSEEIVQLAEQRLAVWGQLLELAGLGIPEVVRERVTADLEEEFDSRTTALRAEYEQKLGELKALYSQTASDFLGRLDALAGGSPLPAPVAAVASASPPVMSEAVAAEAAPVEDDGELSMGPYIESATCTTCDECTNLNRKLFAYDDQKKAYIKDPRAGSFREIVMAAERCPAEIIHPGTPLNANEKDLEKWIKRAERFN